jgi:hypothetical protein
VRDQLSAVLRDELVAEVGKLSGGDEAAQWALRALPAKNSLTDAHAHQVEEVFEAKLASFAETAAANEPAPQAAEAGTADQEEAASPAPAPHGVDLDRRTSIVALASDNRGQEGARKRSRKPLRPQEPDASRLTLDGSLPFALTDGVEAPAAEPTAPRIDKADLALSDPRRHRDRCHLKFVTMQPCLLCGRRPSDAHHLRFAQSAALGRRVSDEFTVPLCRLHHRALHRRGDEAAWWAEQQVEPLQIAQKLWTQTRGNGARLSSPLAAIGPTQ